MKKILKQYFGHDQFRPMQEEIVEHFLDGRDGVVVMPTGGGKSLCFQLPALRRPGVTIVISPLISLMKDQVDALLSHGIPATMLNSNISYAEQCYRMRLARKGMFKLIYMAPERLARPETIEWLRGVEVSAFVVDEAHCISQWGHDFRPEYRQLKVFRQQFADIPILALSASATLRVRTDIVEQLCLKDTKVFVSGFYRENLHIRVVSKRNALQKVLSILERYKNESCIIYCYSRKDTQEIAHKLSERGISAGCYHAGLDPDERGRIQDLFVRDKIKVVSATVAFGMGIDKSNVRLVIHMTFPKTLEGYYQEIGRAGRDGLGSECIMLYSAGDKIKHDFFIEKLDNVQQKHEEKKKLKEIMEYAESQVCRWNWITTYFGQDESVEKCGSCDVCMKEDAVEMFDATEIAQKILSAVVRTGNAFGKNHVIQVLRGSLAKTVTSRAHEKLSVWGIAKEYSSDKLMNIFSQLVSMGLLQKNSGEYTTYFVTRKGAHFLQAGEELILQKMEEEDIIIEPSKTNMIQEESYNESVFEALRVLRRKIADKKGVPAFVVFSDASLREMARALPTTSEEFLAVNGVGQQKLKEYGDVFTARIVALIQEKES